MTRDELITSRTAGVFCWRLPDVGDRRDGALQLVATRRVRPATFNGLRVQPAHGPAGARRMAAGAHKMAHEIDSWRSWAAGHPPILEHVEAIHGQVTVDVVHYRINHSGAPDVGSPVVAYKALLDGLADAGVLPRGDGPDVVRRVTFHPYEVVGFDGLRVVLTTVPGTEQGALDLAGNRPANAPPTERNTAT